MLNTKLQAITDEIDRAIAVDGVLTANELSGASPYFVAHTAIELVDVETVGRPFAALKSIIQELAVLKGLIGSIADEFTALDAFVEGEQLTEEAYDRRVAQLIDAILLIVEGDVTDYEQIRTIVREELAATATKTQVDSLIAAIGRAEASLSDISARLINLGVTASSILTNVSDAGQSAVSNAILLSLADGSVKVWDPVDNVVLLTLASDSDVYSGWSRDGSRFATADASGTVSVYDTVTYQVTESFEAGAACTDLAWISTASVSSYGLAVTTVDKKVMIYPLAGMSMPHATLDGSTQQPHTIATQNGGLYVASGHGAFGSDFVVRVWDHEFEELIHTISGFSSAVHSVAFSPDNTMFAAGSGDGANDTVIRVWNSSSWSPSEWNSIGVLSEHASPIYALNFSADGQRMASADGNGIIKIWDMVTLTQSGEIAAHSGAIYSLSWSPDGYQLVSGGQDNFVRIWNTTSLDEVASIEPSDSDVLSVSWNPSVDAVLSNAEMYSMIATKIDSISN